MTRRWLNRSKGKSLPLYVNVQAFEPFTDIIQVITSSPTQSEPQIQASTEDAPPEALPKVTAEGDERQRGSEEDV